MFETNILRLPELVILDTQESGPDLHVYVEVAQKPTQCALCGSPQIVGYGRRQQRFMDLPAQAQRVGIYVDRRRFMCRSCGQTFREEVPYVDEDRMMTVRLREYIQKQAIVRTFTSIATDVGVNEKTVRNIFRDFSVECAKTFSFQTPEVLGVDELHLLGSPRCILTNVKERCIVDLLRDRNKPTLQLWLGRMPNKERVRVVNMDMWKPYRDLMQAVLPNAEVVIDKFHVVRMASDALEKVRKDIRAKLTPGQRKRLMHDRFVLLTREADLDPRQYIVREVWFASFPQLKSAYELKEQFYDLFDLPGITPDEARSVYESWKMSIPANLQDGFSDVVRAVDNWAPEIYAYFEHRTSNAYTEAKNGIIKLMSRNGRGYSFDALRAKVLYSKQAHRHPKFKALPPDAIGLYTWVDERPYGADISTLLDNWDSLTVEAESITDSE